MRSISIVAQNIFSPLGNTMEENFESLKKFHSGIQLYTDITLSSESFYASMFQKNFSDEQYTNFEKILIHSVRKVLNNIDIDFSGSKTIFILSTTKGNIELLEKEKYSDALNKRIALHTSAKLIAQYFGFANKPIVVSNACISGVLALLVAKRLLENNIYDHAIVAGADKVSKFVLSGFQSFHAISSQPCKPYDVARDGLSLGEAAATIILSADNKYANAIKILSGAVRNDANHISGPSRTGAELNMAINKTLNNVDVDPKEIDFVSAHGTATLYNDEMEAKALTLSGLQSVPVNSLKGFYGHTLGAAGIVESAVTIQSMKENIIIPTFGFDKLGVSKEINVVKNLQYKTLNKCLKIASGFGGCNASVLFAN